MVTERNRLHAFRKRGTLYKFDVSEMAIGRLNVGMNRNPNIDVR